LNQTKASLPDLTKRGEPNIYRTGRRQSHALLFNGSTAFQKSCHSMGTRKEGG
jgi:hypothetical protein